jgi:hypothetical protein
MRVNSKLQRQLSDLMLIIALIFFVTGAFCGFFLTSLPKLTHNNWFWLFAGRIAWQLGGAIWFCASVCDPQGESQWKGAVTGIILGGLLCFNPLFDIIKGPQKIEGIVTDVQVSHGKIWRKNGAYSNTIHSRIYIETTDKRHQIKLSGRQANLWSDKFMSCKKPSCAVHTLILLHTNIVLDISCSSK